MMIEGQQLLAGGTDSGSHMLTTITYHLLANPDAMAKLKKELKEATPDQDSGLERLVLEKLPYLDAVIKETFRLHPPVAFCMERVAPE